MAGRRVLVSGATGFIGRYLVDALRVQGNDVVVLTRNPDEARTLWTASSVILHTADLTAEGDLEPEFRGVDTAFHLAGHAHAEVQDSPKAKLLHHRTTVLGTRRLLQAAVAVGVRRLVFLSSVKAMGEGADECLDEFASATPFSHYGRAKLEAEGLVLTAGRHSGMHTAILRLPPVYGRGNKGNIPRMIAAIDRGRFPPLPDLHNRRSMVHVEDVVQALLLAAERPEASGQVYIVTDGRVYSASEIYRAICQALGRKVPNWSVPLWVLSGGARAGDMIGRIAGRRLPLDTATMEKLLGSAWYSSDKISRELGYSPRYSLYDALPEMVAEYRRGAREAERKGAGG